MAQEFECGYFCDFTLTEQLITTLTCLPLLGYAAYLERTKERTRAFQVVRLLAVIHLVFRIIGIFVPNTLAANALTSVPTHFTLFAGYFEWHKTVVEVSYRAVRLSSEPPIWVWRYTRINQAVNLLSFSILYGLGGSPRGNPRCSTVQALTNATIYIPSLLVGISLIFCLFVVSKQVSRLVRDDQSTGAPSAKKKARYEQALKKIRRISVAICFVALVNSIDLLQSLAARGEPTVSCGGVFADVIYPLTGTLSAFLLLWTTSARRTEDNSSIPSSQQGNTSTGTYHTKEPPVTTRRSGTVPSRVRVPSMSPTPPGFPPQQGESIVISEICVSSLSGSPVRTNA